MKAMKNILGEEEIGIYIEKKIGVDIVDILCTRNGTISFACGWC